MSDTTNTNPPKPEETKKIVKPFPKVVEAIKPSQVLPHPGADGEMTYYITYVTSAGRQVTAPCTKAVWRWHEQDKPWNDCHAEWILETDMSGQVLGVVRKPRPRQGPLPTKLVTDPNKLVLIRAGQSYEPINLPNRFDSDTLGEAIAALSDAGAVKPGDQVGRFSVVQTVSDADESYVTLDLTNKS